MARDAKYDFDRLIDTARAEAVTVEKRRETVETRRLAPLFDCLWGDHLATPVVANTGSAGMIGLRKSPNHRNFIR